MGRAFYIESVEDAAALAGGYDQLADALGVSAGEVRGWAAGTAIPEVSALLRLIDLVTGAPDPRGRSTTASPATECSASAAANRLSLEG
jgi:transcriptional regulator with XRE-family HTH domain